MFDFSFHKVPHAKSFHENLGIDEYENDPDYICEANEDVIEGLHSHLTCVDQIDEWFEQNPDYYHNRKFLAEFPKKQKDKDGKKYYKNKPKKMDPFRHHYHEDERRRQDDYYKKMFKDPNYEVGKHWTPAEIIASTKRKLCAENTNGTLKRYNLRELKRFNQLMDHLHNSDRLVDMMGQTHDWKQYKINLSQQFQKNIPDDEWVNVLPEALRENFAKERQLDL